MGTPEDVACEKYFTPLDTFTYLLQRNMNMEPDNDAEAKALTLTLVTIKDTLKEWLMNIAIGKETHDTLEMRKTLISLVDEP